MNRLLAAVLLAPVAFVAAPGARAADAYLEAGLPGVIVGVGEPINDRADWRLDVATLGSRSGHRTIGSIDYDGTLKADRLASLADWFVANGFYLCGGATLNHAVADLVGHAHGGTIKIGNTTYAAGPDDQVNAQVRFPDVMPYLGLGWRSAPRNGKGWGFVFDAGLSIGHPTVTGGVSGPLLSQAVQPQDIQQALDQVRDKADQLHGIPQLSLGASYRF